MLVRIHYQVLKKKLHCKIIFIITVFDYFIIVASVVLQQQNDVTFCLMKFDL